MMQVSELVQILSNDYMTRQIAVIIGVFIVGLAFSYTSGLKGYKALLYGYPTGLALFAVSGFLMLCLGIPFGALSVLIAMTIIIICCMVYFIKAGIAVDIKREIPYLIPGLIIIVAFAVIFTANIPNVAVDNDSFYYFSTFPEAIVKEGRYIKYFDVFLTDAAPIGSIIYTLPYLFGFGETFGIQHLLNLNFLLIFADGLYCYFVDKLDRKGALGCAAVTTAFLATSSAYLTTAKWVMAGVYFMSYYFITAIISYDTSKKEPEDRSYALIVIMAVMTAMLRHEGPILLAVLALTLAGLKEYKGRELAFSCMLPAAVVSSLYYIRVFAILGVNPLYSFLTAKKAVVIVLALVACSLYLLFVRDRLSKTLRQRMLLILPAMALVLNIAMLAVKGESYINNLRMFYLNVRIRAGWGYFGYIAVLFIAMLVIRALIKKEFELPFFDSLALSYVFSVFLVALGRGDDLRKGVGDSGNRVMLTAVPLIVFSIATRLMAYGGHAKGKVYSDGDKA